MAGPPQYPDTRTGLNRLAVPLPRTHTMSTVPLTHLKRKLQIGFVSKDPLTAKPDSVYTVVWSSKKNKRILLIKMKLKVPG